MIRQLFLRGLLETGPAHGGVLAIRDGLVNLYALRGRAGLVCIDSGWRPACVARSFETLGLSGRDVVAVLLTHLHWDHARGLEAFPKAEVFVGERERPQRFPKGLSSPRPLTRLRDAQGLEVAGLSVQVMSTPGHTPGSVSYLVEGRFLFSGDTLRLHRGEVFPFRAHLNQDRQAQIRSIQKLAALGGAECLLTGHTGLTCDLVKAFRRWRGELVRPLAQEAPGL